MKTYLTVYSTVLLIALSSPSTHANTDGFARALQDYYLSSQTLQSNLLQASHLFEKTLTQVPQVEGVIELSEKLPKAVEAYKENFEAIERLAGDSDIRDDYQSVLKTLDEDEASNALPVLSGFSEAFEEFSESLQQRRFTVYAQEGWANSGIQVQRGDLIWVKSEGVWQASSSYSAVNSGGYICRSDAYALNRNFPLGALLFRVRGSSNINGVGLDNNSRGKADASGRLEFIMNDEDRRNNAGQQMLTVVVMNESDLRAVLQSFKEMNELARR